LKFEVAEKRKIKVITFKTAAGGGREETGSLFRIIAAKGEAKLCGKSLLFGK